VPTPEEIRSGVIETAMALEKNNDVHLIYQVHPSQAFESVKDLLRDIPQHNYIVCRYNDTEELIKSSDAMITFFFNYGNGRHIAEETSYADKSF